MSSAFERAILVRTRTLAEAGREVAKAVKHRKWHWSRRMNGFCDLPIWREIAEQLSLPLFQVQAFANRLEEFANNAGNLGHARGYVGHFRATEFAAATGMSAEDAARIHAALEHPAVAWIAFDHIADFYDRNRDSDGEDGAAKATERKRRQRDRERRMKEIAREAAAGLLTPEQRRQMEAELLLDGRLARKLSTGGGHTVTDVTQSDGHTRADQTFTEEDVDNSGDADRGETERLPEGQVAQIDEQSTEAQLWFETEAVALVVACMNEETPRAAMLIERWRRDLDDATAATMIRGVAAVGLMGAQFQVAVEQAIKRALSAKERGAPLPLRPVLFGPASRPSTAGRHDVTPAAVDKSEPEDAIDPTPITRRTA